MADASDKKKNYDAGFQMAPDAPLKIHTQSGHAVIGAVRPNYYAGRRHKIRRKNETVVPVLGFFTVRLGSLAHYTREGPGNGERE